MKRPQKAIPEGIRITKVGLWYVLITLVIAIAATNSGNNALYMVWALMLATLVVSGVISRENVRNLHVELEEPVEVFANQPFRVPFALTNRGRWWPRWLLLFSILRQGQPWLLPYLPRGGTGRGEVELLMARRGRQSLEAAHVSSLFPFGLFRKGARYKLGIDLLVFPEIFPASTHDLGEAGEAGEESARRPGWGHELHSMRSFRAGDDPRGVHWKQTARTGKMIFMEREAEESRRISIVFDNAVGELETDGAEARFERLVSEAATAAVDYLKRGFEVELVTRDQRYPYAGGPHQRQRVLEGLALVEALPRGQGKLFGSDPKAPQIRLAMSRSSFVEEGTEVAAG